MKEWKLAESETPGEVPAEAPVKHGSTRLETTLTEEMDRAGL